MICNVPHQGDFLLAYWEWKRRIRTEEPDPTEFGLDPIQGERIARQAHVAFEQQRVNEVLRQNRERHGK